MPSVATLRKAADFDWIRSPESSGYAITNRKLYLYDYIPLLIILSFNILTYLLFLFGPWNWPIISYFKLNLFMGSVFIALYLGYKKGVKREPQRLKSNEKIFMLFNIIFYLQFILIPVTLISRTGSLFSLEKILNPGQSYMDAHSMRDAGGWFVYVEYIRVIFSPLLTAFVPVSIFLWNRLSKVKRIFIFIQLFFILVADLQRGTNKRFMDLIIYLIVVDFVSFVNRNKQKYDDITFRKKFRKKLKKLFILGCIMVVLFVSFFQLGMKGRSGGLNIYSPNASTVLDTEHWMLKPFRDRDTKIAIGMFYSYLTQGYYALDIALNKPFIWTYGLGHSLVVMLNADEYIPVMKRSYVFRMEIEDGWKMMRQWHSFYTWIASDVTFFGVIIVLFLLAYI